MSESQNSDSDPPRYSPLDATTKVIQEDGRWVVMLNVTTWDPSDDGHPVANDWKRINDFSSQQEAEVAASWIEKSVNRQIRPPMGF